MTRWIVHAAATFTARHALTAYHGQPEASHEHTWQVAIRIGVDELNAEGYAIDFHLVKQLLEAATSPLHGTDLNHHPWIGSRSAAAERVALFIAQRLRGPVTEAGGRLQSVSVWEGPDNRVDLVLESPLLD